jgi:2-succinyl-6-hydroxy-2,4-cyclohexadiene-1-carboxylate synthase
MTCVLLHGFTGTPGAWLSFIDRARLDPAPIAITLPGHLGTDVAPTWDANLDAIASRIAHRGGAGAPVVGYSLGARVALGLVARGLAPSAVLIGVHPGLADAAERAARRAADLAWIELLETRGIEAFADAWEAQPVLAARHATPDALARRAAARRSHDPRLLARSLATLGLAEMPDYRAALTGARVHLVAGAEDAKFLAIARELAAEAALPLDVVDESGHDPTLDAPAALAAVVGGALRRLTGAEQGATVGGT